jgi:hypothetical protein
MTRELREDAKARGGGLNITTRPQPIHGSGPALFLANTFAAANKAQRIAIHSFTLQWRQLRLHMCVKFHMGNPGQKEKTAEPENHGGLAAMATTHVSLSDRCLLSKMF